MYVQIRRLFKGNVVEKAKLPIPLGMEPERFFQQEVGRRISWYEEKKKATLVEQAWRGSFEVDLCPLEQDAACRVKLVKESTFEIVPDEEVFLEDEP